jgi:predicted metal-binding membrane protein
MAAAWAVLAADALRAGAAAHGMPPMPGMPHMAMGGHHHHAAALYGLPHWLLMVVAMMGPGTLLAIRHTLDGTLVWRRGRAVLEFALGYLLVWTLAGAVLLAGTAAWQPRPWLAFAGAAALAGAWQVSRWKQRALWACHRPVPLPPRGLRAELGALRFGVRNGTACVRSCWALMLAMLLAPTAPFLCMALLGGVATVERLLARPRHATRLGAVALAAVSIAALAVA